MADGLNPDEKTILDRLDVYARPDYQLSFLPVPMRWEVTRRHPSYSLYWQMAEWRCRDDIVLSLTDQARSEIAVGLLKLIGVATKPPSPAKEFSELDDEGLLTVTCPLQTSPRLERETGRTSGYRAISIRSDIV